MHSRPTSLLYTLEGVSSLDLDWEKLLGLKSSDGSFLFSPSSTAFAYMQTGDETCLNYLKNVVQRFQGGGTHKKVPHIHDFLFGIFFKSWIARFLLLAPSGYPVDLFERIWAIDRLQRLGISRYFLKEIRDSSLYVYRYIFPTSFVSHFFRHAYFLWFEFNDNTPLRAPISRHWTELGIGWARNSPVTDLDDTAMGFRILRLNGYDVCSGKKNNFFSLK